LGSAKRFVKKENSRSLGIEGQEKTF